MEKTEKNQKEDCVFCKITRGEIPSVKIWEDDNFFVINDLHPLSEGHCLVVPKRHYETLLDVPSTFGTEIMDVAKKQGLRLMKDEKAEGFNLVQNNFKAGGQLVPHFHIHIVPRKLNDNVKLE